MAGKVERHGAAEGVAAEARPGEDRLGQHRAGEQIGVGEAAERDDRDQRVRQDVADHDAALAQALGARDAHVVLLHAFQHAGARRARDQAERRRREHDRRQDQMRERIAERVPVAGERAVDQIEAGDRRAAASAIASIRPGPGRDLQAAVEHRQHDEGEPEGRRRHADQRDEPRQMIDPAVAPHRRDDAERNADDDREQERDASQARSSPARSRAMSCEHRPLRRDRDAEIAVEEAAAGRSSSARHSGRSRPHLARHSATNSLFEAARSPSCASTGSPGTVLAIRKMTSVASNAITTASASRDRM